ncbi:MAG: hypothetical protein ACKVQU_09685 [Burkholderiales bacterium]
MQRKMAMLIGVVLITFAAGCAQFSIPSTAPGTSANDVKARLGTPSDERTIGGTKAWDYVQGPQGFTTWRVLFDGSDRVAKVEQLLTESRITSVNAGKLTRADVSNLLGRPLGVWKFAGGASEVWSYRFMDANDRKLGDVYFDGATGIAKHTTTYLDPAYHGAIND